MQNETDEKQQRFEQQLEACRTEIQLELRVRALEAQLATLRQRQPPTPDWDSLSDSLSDSCLQVLTGYLNPLLEKVASLETFKTDMTTAYNENVAAFKCSVQASKEQHKQLKAEVVSLQDQVQTLEATVTNLQEQSQKKGWFR